MMRVRNISSLFRTLAVVGLAVWLGGCVSTEAVSTPPHINLSPANMSFGGEETGEALDFGLDVTRNESDSLENLSVLPGLRVRSVRSGSVADLAGIRAGDVILAVNDMETNQPDALAALAAASDSGEFAVKARRGTTVYSTTMAKPEQRRRVTPEELYRVDPLRSRAGYRTALVSIEGEQRSAARIAEIFPDSPLAEAGLQVGDLLLALDGDAIDSAQGLVNRLQAKPLGAGVNLAVMAQSEPEPETIRLELWEPERRLSSLALWPLFHYKSSLDPPQTRLKVGDLILFSVFSYERQRGERTWRLLGIFEFGSGYGTLVEESP